MRRTAAQAAETRRQVLDAATMALAERGYDGATFEHIAGRIGLTRGAVHHHFGGGKDELLTTLLREQWSRYGQIVLGPLHDTARAPARRLEDFLVDYLARLVEDPLFRALATVTTLVAPLARTGAEQAVAEHSQALEGWRDTLRQVLDGAGPLRAGVTTGAATFLLTTTIVGANDTAALEADQLPQTDTERRAVATVLLGGLLETIDREASVS